MDVGRGQRALETLEALVAVDLRGLGGLDTVALHKLSARSTLVQSWLAAFDIQLATAAAALTASTGRPIDPEPVVSGGGRKTRRDAAATIDRANACATVPGVADALAAGELAAGHVDAIATVTRNMSDTARERFAGHADGLIDHGRFDTPEEFARRCKQLAATVIDETERLARQERCRRQRKLSRWTDTDGMCHTKLSLDPLADAQIWAVINDALGTIRSQDQRGDDRSFDQLRADILTDLITRPATAGDSLDDVGDGSGQPAGAEVTVVCDLVSLLGHARTSGIAAVCETGDGQPLPVATVRRLCCDARILPVVLNGDGLPVDVGRTQRLATRAQRQALRTLYATCAHPQCNVGFERCRIHHTTFWDNRGSTDLDNLIPLCERHHHLVHEGGWTLTTTPDRTTTWTTPEGRIAFHGDSRNRTTIDTIDTIDTTHAPRAGGAGSVGVGVGGASTSSRTTDHGTATPSTPPATPTTTTAAATTGAPATATGPTAATATAAIRTTEMTAAAPTARENEQARRMADEVARRRQHTDTAAAVTARTARRRTSDARPLPLFGTDDTLQRRGPPHAG